MLHFIQRMAYFMIVAWALHSILINMLGIESYICVLAVQDRVFTEFNSIVESKVEFIT